MGTTLLNLFAPGKTSPGVGPRAAAPKLAIPPECLSNLPRYICPRSLRSCLRPAPTRWRRLCEPGQQPTLGNHNGRSQARREHQEPKDGGGIQATPLTKLLKASARLRSAVGQGPTNKAISRPQLRWQLQSSVHLGPRTKAMAKQAQDGSRDKWRVV